MKIQLSELVWDGYVYPRKNKSNKTIEAYTEAITIGAQFPPLEVQRVCNYDGEPRDHKGEALKAGDLPTDSLVIIDGVHRWIAYHQYNTQEKSRAKEREQEPRLITEVEVTEWKPEALDYVKHKIELRLESSERNTKHGDRIGEGDKKATAQRVAEDDPEQTWTEQAIADKLGVKRQRVNEWISAIRQRQKAGRDAQIVKLSRLGWMQEEIAGVIGLERSSVTKIVKNAEFGKIHKMLSEDRSMDYIADHYQMDLALAWALRLEGKEDRIRFRGDVSPGTKTEDLKELRWGVRTWDNWYFSDCDERFGDACDGRIPAQLVAHTLFYFTRQGDLVMDPMAGGGVVPDVCLLFERKCRAYDMVTSSLRPEIEEHYWDFNNMQWPAMKKKPDFIFFDPPYFTKKAQEYEERVKEQGERLPISSLPREQYLAVLKAFFVLAHENTKGTTRLAFLNADWRDFQSMPALEEDSDKAVTIFDYERLLSTTGWQVTHRIESPLSSERFSGGMVSAMQESRILGTVGRTLLVTKKGKKNG